VSQTNTPPSVCLGHIRLRVVDLERSTTFYRDVLGFHVTVDGAAMGLPAVFLATGDYHHHIALNTFGAKPTGPAPANVTGPYHFALVYADPLALIEAVERLHERKYPISHGSDHGGTVSIYLQDPDGNGIELYYDRGRKYWLDASGGPMMRSEFFDPADLPEVLGWARRLAVG
jgi:catechol 2,3-dioxygenase